jgi:hypothetical protein
VPKHRVQYECKLVFFLSISYTYVYVCFSSHILVLINIYFSFSPVWKNTIEFSSLAERGWRDINDIFILPSPAIILSPVLKCRTKSPRDVFCTSDEEEIKDVPSFCNNKNLFYISELIMFLCKKSLSDKAERFSPTVQFRKPFLYRLSTFISHLESVCALITLFLSLKQYRHKETMFSLCFSDTRVQ